MNPGVYVPPCVGVPDKTPVFGGSAADHAIAGGWSTFSDEGADPAGLSLAALAGEVRIGSALAGPYEPTTVHAKISEPQAEA